MTDDFTSSLRQAQKSIEALTTGIVCVNNTAAATAEMPVGGVKYSGFGRENYRRLATVKAQYDPDNVFRLNHNIRPFSG